MQRIPGYVRVRTPTGAWSIAVSETYLTSDQLAEPIHCNARTILTRLTDSVLLEGVRYIRPFCGRNLLFIGKPSSATSVRRLPRVLRSFLLPTAGSPMAEVRVRPETSIL